MPLTVLITGCSSPQGIGFATARELDAAGHTVVATVRDHSHDEQLLDGTKNLSVLPLDLLDRDSIRQAVENVIHRYNRLDTLINNAGYGLIGGIEECTPEQVQAEFATNYFGTIDLVRAVLPVMRAQGGGHIIAVSSVFVPALCPPAIGHYVGTKAALESALQALAAEQAGFGIRVTNVQPGPVDTDLSRDWARPDNDPLPTLIDDLYAWIQAAPGIVLEPAEEVAKAIAAVVADPDPPLAFQTSAAAHRWVARALIDPSRQAERPAG